MTTRIKELKQQATDYVDSVDDGLGIEHYRELVDLKFAELIVRECANQCDLLLDHKISSEWARGTHDCSRAIKKHFGVEE